MTGLVFMFGAFAVAAVFDLRRRWREADEQAQAAAENLAWDAYKVPLFGRGVTQ